MNTTNTVALTDFLLARIAEEESAARIAQFNNGRWTHTFTFGMETAVTRDYGPAVVEGYGSLNADDHAHIARHDPARVLAECEAKRRIIGLVDWPGERLGIQQAMRRLAAVYADHPDYRSEWRP